MTCSQCGGPGYELGSLGRLTWFRCRNCGMEWSVGPPGDYQDFVGERTCPAEVHGERCGVPVPDWAPTQYCGDHETARPTRGFFPPGVHDPDPWADEPKPEPKPAPDHDIANCEEYDCDDCIRQRQSDRIDALDCWDDNA